MLLVFRGGREQTGGGGSKIKTNRGGGAHLFGDLARGLISEGGGVWCVLIPTPSEVRFTSAPGDSIILLKRQAS